MRIERVDIRKCGCRARTANSNPRTHWRAGG